MINKDQIKALNVVPEGTLPWLTYDQYVRLGDLFNAVRLPEDDQVGPDYWPLQRFLSETAGLPELESEAAIHSNAFTLLRRGYQVEQITLAEYDDLVHLMDGIEEPDPSDMELHDTGDHRALYDYLTKQMGLSVRPGRGPAWHRAKALIDNYPDKP